MWVGLLTDRINNQLKNSNLINEHAPNREPVPSRYKKSTSWLFIKIDLFTDTAALLNLLDLRSFMGYPGGTPSVFTRASRAKRELHCVFLGKKAIIITSKHGKTIFFSHYNLFLGKCKEQLARKARVNTERVYRILLVSPGHLIILLKSNEFNMVAVSVKRSIAKRLE